MTTILLLFNKLFSPIGLNIIFYFIFKKYCIDVFKKLIIIKANLNQNLCHGEIFVIHKFIHFWHLIIKSYKY